ncbi:MAG: hypothetical protein L3J36_08675 [Rhodobacteraceae bacterium]|nr:hypothetical protein [Paracoccaceae bacterium]
MAKPTTAPIVADVARVVVCAMVAAVVDAVVDSTGLRAQVTCNDPLGSNTADTTIPAPQASRDLACPNARLLTCADTAKGNPSRKTPTVRRANSLGMIRSDQLVTAKKLLTPAEIYFNLLEVIGAQTRIHLAPKRQQLF